jgi:ribosomal protein S18 acetylase RimI-like enzyme
VTVNLRPESVADEPFIRRLIMETVAEELGAAAWPEPMRNHLLGIQYAARRQAHLANPAAASHVIQADGTDSIRVDAGWAVVNRMPHEVRLVEIMLLPEMRGKGIGTAVIHEVLASAAAAGKPLRLNVNMMNQGAIRFYERLGFLKTAQDAVQYLMEHD